MTTSPHPKKTTIQQKQSKINVVNWLCPCMASLNDRVDPEGKPKSAVRTNPIMFITKEEEPVYQDFCMRMRYLTGNPKAQFPRTMVLDKSEEPVFDALVERVRKLELEDARKNVNKRANGGMPNGVIPVSTMEDPHGVTADELKTLIDKRATRFLLIDTRSPTDFTSLHPKHPDSISISNVILAQGQSANALGSKIKYTNPESYETWNRRGTFDLIILYDWSSSFDQKETHPTSPLFVLYETMTQWDPNTKYKGPIKILQGGIRNFYHNYPSYFTNPWSSNGPSNNEVKATAPISLDAISYPSLDDHKSTSEENNNPNHNNSTRTIKTNPTVNGTNKPMHLITQEHPLPHPPILPITNGIASGEKTMEDHAKELAAFMDDLISVARETAAEVAWLRIHTSHVSGSADSQELQKTLREKEKIIEDITLQLQTKTAHFNELEANYERSLETEGANRTFPSVRKTRIESEVAAKEKLMEELAGYVTKIQEKRRREAEGLFKGPLVNGHHSDDTISYPSLDDHRSHAGELEEHKGRMTELERSVVTLKAEKEELLIKFKMEEEARAEVTRMCNTFQKQIKTQEVEILRVRKELNERDGKIEALEASLKQKEDQYKLMVENEKKRLDSIRNLTLRPSVGKPWD